MGAWAARRRWRSWILWRVFAALLCAVPGWAWSQSALATEGCDAAQSLSQALRSVQRGDTVLAQAPVQLPDRLEFAWRRESVQVSYRLDIARCAGSAHAALWLPRVGAPYRLRVDGQILLPTLPQVAVEPSAVSHAVLNGRVPSLFLLPPGSREAEVELVTMAFMSTGLVGVDLGPAPLLVPRHVEGTALVPGVNDTVAVVALVAGLLALLAWGLRRQDLQLLWFSLCALTWGLRGIFYGQTPLPLPPMAFEQMVPVLTLIASLALAATTLAWMAALSRRRGQFGLALLAVGLGSFVLAGLLGEGAAVARAFAYATGILMMPWLIVLLWRARERLGAWRAAVLIFTYATALAAALLDIGLVLGWRHPAGMSWLLPGFAGLLTCMAVLLAEYALRQLSRAERSNEELERRVAEKSRSLELGFAERREHERAAARALERERLMREMHDGLGGQLMTVLRGVERGAMPRELVLHALQESLDDLRLLMDSAGQDAVLAASLAAWRSRWEPRLASLGVVLDWDIDEALDELLLPPGVGLHLMRIVQEATVNVVKHARASRLSLWAGRDAQGAVQIRIRDNGCGLAAGVGQPGARGLVNMRHRARQIGAELQFGIPPEGHGLQIDVRLPLPTAPDSIDQPATGRLEGRLGT